jgi:hypothetical protein
MVQHCPCEGCVALRQEYKNDPGLLAFYAKKLLVRGWAKQLSDTERLYLSSHAEWYKAAQESGRWAAANLSRNIKDKALDPQVGEASSELADLETTPRKG